MSNHRAVLILCLVLSLAYAPLALAVELKDLPSLEFSDLPNFSITYGENLDITGKVSSPFGIRSVYIDNQKAALKDGEFSLLDIPLKSGKNVFIVRAIDNLGNKKGFLYTIYRQEPPKEGVAYTTEPLLQPVISDNIPITSEGTDSPKETIAKIAPEVKTPAAISIEKPAAITGTRSVTTYTATTIPKTSELINSLQNKIDNIITKISSIIEKEPLYPKEPEINAGKPVLTFLSPYSNQIITDNSLKITGRFNQLDNVTGITINNQSCIIDPLTNTFTGPTLISSGEARSNNVTSDSSKYIIMKVDSNTHSGKNILKITITTDNSRTYKEELTFYYYQLFVYSIVDYSVFEFFSDAGPGSNWQVWNAEYLNSPPFSDWTEPTCDKRAVIYPRENEDGSIQTYYYPIDNPNHYLKNYKTSYSRRSITYEAYPENKVVSTTTKMMLHAPPVIEKTKTPLVLLFYGCSFLETATGFPGSELPALNLSSYKVNKCPLRPLSGNSCYIVLNDYTPDTDIKLTTDLPPPYDPGLMIYPGMYITEGFSFEALDTLAGNILIDADNDGFLGGEDNILKHFTPGCVFWVNDDDDYDESSVHPDDETAVNSNGNDSADEFINGIRDLEDFMPIDITVPNIQTWKDVEGVKFYLKMKGEGKIRIFKRVDDNDEEGTKTYLLDLGKSIEQYKQKPMPFDEDNKDEIMLDLNSFNSEGKFYGIFEGVKKGQIKLSLIADFNNGQDRVVLDEAYITIVDVRSLFKVYNTRYDSSLGDREGPTIGNDGLLRYRFIREQEGYGARFPQNPNRIIIWTHGYNNTTQQSLNNMSIIFKRLYVTGFRGGFIGVVWKVGHSSVDFNSDWEQSYRTGHIFADIIRNTKNSYPNAKLDLFTHSLGNNVACYALRLLSEKNEAIVDNFILHEAAVPGEVFCGEYGKISHKWEFVSVNNIPIPLYQYREGFFDNIYSESLKAVNGKVYNTYCPEDKAVRDMFWLNNNLFKLPTPLDDWYNFIKDPINTHPASDYKGLGCSEIKTIFNDKIKSRDQLNHKEERPSGIKGHGSQSEEYYYDVAKFFERVNNLKIMDRDINY